MSETIRELFLESCRRRGGAVALRFKREGAWRERSYAELLERTRRVSERLGAHRCRAGERIGLFLDNCPEWPELYFGIVSVGCQAVPIDAKLRDRDVAHILRHSGCKLVFASSRTYRVMREIADDCRALETVVLLAARELGLETQSRVRYVHYEEAPDDAPRRTTVSTAFFDSHAPSANDVASIIYTSGTTGRPKGAMLSHGNFCANVQSALNAVNMSATENFLLVLPLHHAFAFTANLLIPIAAGAEISLVESLKTVGENVREVSPTILIGVPLLIEKMYARIREGLRRKPLAHALYALGIRKPVIRGIRNKLGGRLRMIITGGAPAMPSVLEGFAALGVTVMEGYGLTETAPILTLNPESAPRYGTVGKALPGVEIRIKDPDRQGVGEITARGPNIMSGYFENPEATREAFDDGWFLTGDLGTIDPDGYVAISGRKKSLIVNREGKNIYPEEVETVIAESPFVLEALVLGFSAPGDRGERVGVIVVPDHDAVERHFAARRAAKRDVEAWVRQDVRKRVAELADFKRPRQIQIRNEEFEKTSTGKIKRYLYEMDAAQV